MVREESQLYRDLMRFKPEGWSPNAWAVAAGVSRTVWTDMRRHGNPSRRTLEKLLTAAGSSVAEFEALRVGRAPIADPEADRRGFADATGPGWRGATLPPLPLVASAVGGFWGDSCDGIELTELRMDAIVGHLPRPASLAADPGAYALTIVDDSMWPRFRPGRHIAVSPKASIGPGDDVLGVLVNGSAALIKELTVRSPDHLEFRQFNPAKNFRVDRSEISAMHKIVGELI